MIILYLVWIFLKLVRGKEVTNPSSYLDVLKIKMEMRGNDLNRTNLSLFENELAILVYN